MDINDEYNKLCEIRPTDAVFKCEDDVDVPFHKDVIEPKSKTVKYFADLTPAFTSIQLPMPSVGVVEAMKALYQPIPANISAVAYRVLEFLDVDPAYMDIALYLVFDQTPQQRVALLREWVRDNVEPFIIRWQADLIMFNDRRRRNQMFDLSTEDFAFLMSIMTCQIRENVMARYYFIAATIHDEAEKQKRIEVEKQALGDNARYFRFMIDTTELRASHECFCSALTMYITSEVVNRRSGAAMFKPTVSTICDRMCITYYTGSEYYKMSHTTMLSAEEADKFKASRI